MTTTDDQGRPDGFKIRGWHVLVAMMGFFGIVIAVNAVFLTLAVQSFPGEDVRKSYLQGLTYNQVIDDRRRQADLGWQAAANLVDNRVLIRVTHNDDTPVSGLQLTGKLRHPANKDLDHELVFNEVRGGVYAALTDGIEAGYWTLTANNQGEDPFEMERGLWQR